MQLPTDEEIREMMTYQTPEPDMLPRFDAIREGAIQFAKIIMANTPASPDRSVAIRDVRNARLHANSAIALKGKF